MWMGINDSIHVAKAAKHGMWVSSMFVRYRYRSIDTHATQC